jgi:GT2 family glycosyltransferase
MIRLSEKMEAEEVPYGPWYEKHKATPDKLNRQRRESASWKGAPLISIVVPVYCTPERFLREMIESVTAQSYADWELVLADASPVAEVGEAGLMAIVSEYSSVDSRIIYHKLTENLGIAENTNAAIALSSGDWIAFLDHDDLLAPDALYEAVSLMRKGAGRRDETTATCWSDIAARQITVSGKSISEDCANIQDGKQTENGVYEPREFEMIYTDEDKVETDGITHFQPHLKPDMNIDLLRSNNYITHFLLVKRTLLDRVGLLNAEYDGAQDYDLILRCTEEAKAIGHVPSILYLWRSHNESTSENPFSKQYAVDAGKRAIEAHLKRTGTKGTVTSEKDMGFYRVDYEVTSEPLISIIIPNKDETDTLRKCLDAIERSDYHNYEVIIVENNSCAETFDFYNEVSSDGHLPSGAPIKIAVWKSGFNYSALNNFGATFAEGEYLLLLNNDIEFIGTDTLRRMLAACERPEVGIVGAKLYYPDDTIQHAGILVGVGGNARGIGINAFTGLAKGRSGYMHKASLAMDYSAVTAACMMVKRSVYDEVGGMEEKLAVAFNDVDFCLKVRRAGYLIVYRPDAKAYHYESKSRGAEDTKEKTDRFNREIEYMRSNWIAILKNGDPYYNPNLTHVYPNYSLRDV